VPSVADPKGIGRYLESVERSAENGAASRPPEADVGLDQSLTALVQLPTDWYETTAPVCGAWITLPPPT
jgi:hypothetical protein